MRTFARDPSNNDLVLTQKNVGAGTAQKISVIDGKAGVAAVIDAIVKTERGEVQLNTNLGVRHLETCLADPDQIFFWKDEMKDAIESCSYVTSLAPITVYRDREAGTLRYEASVTTTEGGADIGGSALKSAVTTGYDDDLVETRGSYSVDDIVTVRFFDWDGVTLVRTVRVINGQSVTAPVLPAPPRGYLTSYAKTVYEKIEKSQDIVADLTVVESMCSKLSVIRPSATAGALCLRLTRTSTSSLSRVYWGDGSYSDTAAVASTQYLTHVYGDDAVHNVLIDANVTWFAIGDDRAGSTDVDSVLYVTGFDRWGEGITSAHSTLKDCTNLVQNTIPAWNPNIMDVSHCYDGCTGLGTETP